MPAFRCLPCVVLVCLLACHPVLVMGSVAVGKAQVFIGQSVTTAAWSSSADNGNPTTGIDIYGVGIKSVAFNMLNGDVYWASSTCHIRKAAWERGVVTTILGLFQVTFSGSEANCAPFSSFTYTPTIYPKTFAFQGGVVSMTTYTSSTTTLSLLIVGSSTNSIDVYDITTTKYSHWAGTGSLNNYVSISNIVKSSAIIAKPQGLTAARNSRFYIACNKYIGVVSGMTTLYRDMISPLSTSTTVDIPGLGQIREYLYYGVLYTIYRVNTVSGTTTTFAGQGNRGLSFTNGYLLSISSDCRRNSLIVGEALQAVREVFISKPNGLYIAGSFSDAYNGPGPRNYNAYNLKYPMCGQIFRHELYVCTSNNEVVTVGMDYYGSGSNLACTTVTKTETNYTKPTADVYVGTGTAGCESGVTASQEAKVRDVTAFQYLPNGDLLFSDLLSVRGVQASTGKLIDVVGTCQSAAGFADNEDPSKVLFKVVYGMHYYNGVVYLTDRLDNKIRSYNVNTLNTVTYAGTGSSTVSINKYRLEASFDTPLRLARFKQRLLFSGVLTITMISLSNGFVTQLFTQNDVGNPHGIGVLRGYVYFVAFGKTVVRQVPITGATNTIVYYGNALQAGTSDTLLSDLNELVIDCTRRMMYITAAPNLVRSINMVSLTIRTIGGTSSSCSSVIRGVGVLATSQCFAVSSITALQLSQKTGPGGFPVLLAGSSAVVFNIEYYAEKVIGKECDAASSTKTHSKTGLRTKDKMVSLTPTTTLDKAFISTLSKSKSFDRPKSRSVSKTLFTQPPTPPPTPTPTPSSTTQQPEASPNQTTTTRTPLQTNSSSTFPPPTPTPNFTQNTTTLSPTPIATQLPVATPTSIPTPSLTPSRAPCSNDAELGYWTGSLCERCVKGYSLESNCTKCLEDFYGLQCERFCDRTTCGNGRGGTCDPKNG
eukprot:PhF_6_TR38179/c0_g1_i1/m.57079